MKIIITKSFEVKYYKWLKKYFELDLFIRKLIKIDFINLKDPYYKIKFNIKWIALRWVIYKSKWDNIVPMVLYLKKDKKYWTNIIWKLFKWIIVLSRKNSIWDIKSWNYIVY